MTSPLLQAKFNKPKQIFSVLRGYYSIQSLYTLFSEPFFLKKFPYYYKNLLVDKFSARIIMKLCWCGKHIKAIKRRYFICTGSLIGMCVGILGGPIGVLLGGSYGALVGMGLDALDTIDAAVVAQEVERAREMEEEMQRLARIELRKQRTDEFKAKVEEKRAKLKAKFAKE